MIFVHGNGAEASSYTGLYQEFASHGYIVLAMDTVEGSCAYTEKEDGTPIERIESDLNALDLRK